MTSPKEDGRLGTSADLLDLAARVPVCWKCRHYEHGTWAGGPRCQRPVILTGPVEGGLEDPIGRLAYWERSAPGWWERLFGVTDRCGPEGKYFEGADA